MVRRHPGEGGCPIFCDALNALHTVTAPMPGGFLETCRDCPLARMRCCKGMNSALGQPAMGMEVTIWFWGVGAL